MMIAVRCSEDNFIYDVHSLVKAFYPAEDVKVYRDGDKDYVSSEGLPDIFVLYGENDLSIALVDSIESPDVKVADVMESKLTESDILVAAKGLDIGSRPEYKNALKQTLYRALSKKTGKSLPWGTLTGIRPTKIAMKLIGEGRDDEYVTSYMRDTYYCSPEKTALSIDIAHYEKEILKNIDYENGYSLYIGIPFCPSTCLYCSFTSYPISLYRNVVHDYIEAVKKEIDYVAASFTDRTLDSVYIGGGTPTTLEADELEDLIGYLKSKLDFGTVKEFTVEAGRADSITRQKLEVLLKLGVTRISVNPQTMNEKTLQIIGRKATAAATVECYKLAREVGFNNINMDLIVGLPDEDIDVVRDTLMKVRELNPDSLTVHSLAIKRASRLAQVIDEMGYETINNTDDIMSLTSNVASDMNMKPYYLYRQKNMSGNFENVGYAREGKAGIYNILIMEEVQTIVALGAGTVTKRVYGDDGTGGTRIERCDTVKDVNLYIEKIDEMIDRKRKLFED